MENSNPTSIITHLVALVSTIVLMVGCSAPKDSMSSGDGTADKPRPTTSAPSIDNQSDGDVLGDSAPESAAATWEKITAPRPCACSDGSEFHYWIRRADPEKVLFYLNGGGACFSKETCFTDPSFVADLSDDQTLSDGIFDTADPNNPLVDYSMITVPYCTGDLHLGTVVHDYGSGDEPAPVRHVGAINATNALTTAAALFPDARTVVVAGGSAGAASSPLYAGLAADIFPNAEIINIADAAGGYPDNPMVTKAIGSLWGITDMIPTWQGAAPVDSEAWSLPGMTVQAAKHAPRIRFVRIDHASDEVQEQFNQLAALTDAPLIKSIAANEQTIRESGADVNVWIADGTDHTILGDADFYDAAIDGRSLPVWIANLLNGDQVEDARCSTCTP